MKYLFLVVTALFSLLSASEVMEGEKVFKTYCWGCHHQSAMAFGPPFSSIAKKRSLEQIEAYIIEPKAMYKAFGYKRSVMPQLGLSDSERKAVAHYILSFKGK